MKCVLNGSIIKFLLIAALGCGLAFLVAWLTAIYDCELFCGACLNKYRLRPECKNESFIKIVERIHKFITQNKNNNDNGNRKSQKTFLSISFTNDDLYKNFKKIVELSLSEGVYITHLDSFRQKEYYYKDVPENLSASYFFSGHFLKR